MEIGAILPIEMYGERVQGCWMLLRNGREVGSCVEVEERRVGR
jgi:hypothetical protein